MRYGKLRSHDFHCTCRRCINEKYRMKLEGKHCAYLPFPGQCHHCGEIRNIVVDIHPLCRWRVLFAREKKDSR